MTLQRKLGLPAVMALVIGDMIGSGIFFTPGELASVASAPWQVYFFWALCGLITLCGALTLAELATLLPRAGVYYHALNEAYGPFAGFLQAWVQMLVSGPGSIAGIAILFGELANQVLGTHSPEHRLFWAIAAILFFAGVNLRGASWGGRTQVLLTCAKLTGLAALIAGGIWVAAPGEVGGAVATPVGEAGFFGTLRFIGLGVAIVLYLRRLDRCVAYGGRGPESPQKFPAGNGHRRACYHGGLPAGELCVFARHAARSDARKS